MKKSLLQIQTEAIKSLFPQATVWNIKEDGMVDLSRHEHYFGRIRVFCCANIFHGKTINFSKLMDCAQILMANEYSIKPSADGNDWVELYYRLSEKELREQRIIDAEANLEKLKSVTPKE